MLQQEENYIITCTLYVPEKKKINALIQHSGSKLLSDF